ncbi:MAG: SRPBCC family protein [Chloroflexi bacterium]|nr:SRPBCC family protein [Chloroflexota bacterium]
MGHDHPGTRVGAMIRNFVRLGLLGAVVAVVAEAVLRRRAAGRAPEPIQLLAVIDAPIEDVWSELIDIEGQPRWMHDMKSVRMEAPGAATVGSRGEATVRMFGIAVTDPVTVTVLEPPTRFGIAHEGVFSGGGTFDLTGGADGTTTIVRWEEILQPPILPHLAALITAPVFRHIFQADIGRFKAIVEVDHADRTDARGLAVQRARG